MSVSDSPDSPGRDKQAGKPPRFSLRTLVRAVVGALISLLLIISATAVVAGIQVSDAQGKLRGEIIPAQTAAEQLGKAYVDEETGQRGFLLAGQPVFLQPYVSGRIHASALEAHLRTLLAGDPQARRILTRVIRAHRRWLTQAAEPQIAARQRGPIPAPALLASTLNGKRLFDALRVQLARLQARTTALTTSQLNRISADQLAANVVTGVAVGLALLVSGLSLVLVRRFVDKPLGRLVSQVSAVAGGAYDHPISTSGPTEVTVLAQAVTSMRASIARNSEALVRARHQLTLTEERERVAADLRDLTIQRVYALGLALASTAARQPRLAATFEPLIDQTDEIIRELRRVIFEIRELPHKDGLRTQLLGLLLDSEQVLGFTPALEFVGTVNDLTSGDVLDGLVEAVRDALSNVARHAQATTATVRIASGDDEVHLTVSDDGEAVPAVAGSEHGLLSLHESAARLGGTAIIGPNTAVRAARRGTRVDWRVPVASGFGGVRGHGLV
jgi:signal transduction histidine kinase